MIDVEKAIEEHGSLIHHICKRYFWSLKRCGLDRDDVLQEVKLCLCKKLKTFDERRSHLTAAVTHHVHLHCCYLYRRLRHVGKRKISKAAIKHLTLTVDVEDPCHKTPLEVNDVNKFLSILSGKNRKIVEEYYGLNGTSSKTYQELGKKYGVSCQWIGFVVKTSLEKMRSRWHTDA